MRTRTASLLIAAALLFKMSPGLADEMPVPSSAPGILAEATARAQAWAEKAIIVGGVILYRNRHTIAGLGLGCATGAMVGATSAAAAGIVTGGVALAGTPQAVALGCGLGGSVGAALGYPMDHMFE